MSTTQQAVDDAENWQQITNLPDFKKWSYGDSPYRVLAYLNETRGHWTALFTSVYGTDSYTIAGNLGKDNTGRIKALANARQFMQDNKYGCPPPGEYEP